MNADTLVSEWKIITDLLPPNWSELARTTGALQRARKIRNPSTLLLLILLHAGAGLSLRQAAARARRSGLAEISDVGLLKRMRASSGWLQALAAEMFANSPLRRPVQKISSIRRIRVVDATTVQEPGSSGTDWRVHYVLGLPSLECDFFEVTDPSGGETYRRLPVEPGDLILADRGYSHREGVAHVVRAQGDVIVRLNTSLFPLEAQGKPFDLLGRMRSLTEHQPAEWPVTFWASGTTYDARLCAVRKSAEAAERAKQGLHREAKKRQTQLRPETLELAEYILVLTTLSAPSASASEILELYRARWQVELAFKRLKSLLSIGHVPKYDPVSARAWIHGKLLTVLLIERLSQEARFFSPWGFPLRATEPVERIH
jgi:hypothetical protein